MISSLLPDNIPIEHYEAAEQVRSYLVSVRGGAPFLSGVDGALLVSWLDEDLKPSTICAAIDKVSLRRRKKRVRTRLTLRACRGELKKLLKKEAPQNITHPASFSGFRELHTFLAAHPFDPALHAHRIAVQDHLRSIEEELEKNIDHVDIEPFVRGAIDAIRSFHEALWEFHIDQHEQLQQEAETELSSLRVILGPVQWRDAVEEVMRDKLRMRFPLLSAQTIWQAINNKN